MDGSNTEEQDKIFQEYNEKQVDAYSALDELTAWLGLCRVRAVNNGLRPFDAEFKTIQRLLFCIGGDLPLRRGSDRKHLFPIGANEWLSGLTTQYSVTLPELHQFVVPGGSIQATELQVARTMALKAYRTVKLAVEDEHSEMILFLNTLSNYFFVLARYVYIELGVQEELFDADDPEWPF
ncbi:ATP:cob(I)alamin adenosyltransferase [Furfurilactobacillus siliginis]|uniref:Corrinoid adenosyltransferase n=1 Tax=Furfurilactobacillus siliginis TaxID=348151 RepID=A0A0R2L361_9LACO|nr:ATP:cob(I)alamin adenosyltransferase [Furfurilactobacillus siliginis]KRN96232.1 hypothetical protein IV55_GL001618 [Furfurilactobacillus siliginis]GEK27843.1 hypothetical protein LSI01_01540 [Furfurilactobacillus siliginis]